MVGIGAAAGGLEALRSLLGAMPSKSGLAFVVVAHTDSTPEGITPELASCTKLKVEPARNRQLLEADHVYVIPPNRTLTLEQGLLRVKNGVDRRERGMRAAIDRFFRSLADDQGDRAIGIVLSGTGTAGTLGAQAIKAAGGLVIAQAPDTAAQHGMPKSVIATGLVDEVLAPTAMPRVLLTRTGSIRTRIANEALLTLNAQLQDKVRELTLTERELRSAQNQLRLLNQTLEQRVRERTKWLTLMHEVTRGIGDAPSWGEALHSVLHRICESEDWQVGYVYLPDRDAADAVAPAISFVRNPRFRTFHRASERQRYTRGQSLPGLVYANGTPVWINDREQLVRRLPVRGEAARDAGLQAAAALPVRFGRDVIAVLELFSDLKHEPNELLENLMNDVSTHIGEVLDRERATARMADLVWREQQELLHTLHDSLGQTLTGLGMMSSGLRQQLTGANQPGADTARQVAEQAQVALEQVRQLSRGLFPLEIDAEGLLPALRELGSTTEAFHKIHVEVAGLFSKRLRDSRAATQLYRIAQEGVTNAVKHARAHRIRIELHASEGVTKLRVIDDGVGISRDAATGAGLGLRIMRYRATSIGAALSINRHAGRGTVVSCTLRDTPLPTEPDTRL